MISTNQIHDNTVERARSLNSPVRFDGAAFVMASATRPELLSHHRVEFDSTSEPSSFSCTCEAHEYGSPCWAAARALDVLLLLAANGVTLAAGEVGAGTGEPAPTTDLDVATARFECKRVFKVEPEGNPEAVLVAPIRKVGKVERVRGFQI
jgi:hypothetical protein